MFETFNMPAMYVAIQAVLSHTRVPVVMFAEQHLYFSRVCAIHTVASGQDPFVADHSRAAEDRRAAAPDHSSLPWPLVDLCLNSSHDPGAPLSQPALAVT